MIRRNRGLAAVAASAALVAATAACDIPFGLDQPTTRSLEDGSVGLLSSAPSFEIAGTYVAQGTRWTMDLMLVRPGGMHLVLTGGKAPLEAIVTGGAAYFRGKQFLLSHVATDARSQQLASAAGDSWWKGLPGNLPKLTDFTDGTAFRSTFLGPAANRRTDHLTIDGIPAVEFSGRRADVYIAIASAREPQGEWYVTDRQPLRLRLHEGQTIDGIESADFRYGNFGRLPAIAPPSGVIDFANLATLPPLYSVVSVDTSQCGSPCVVKAQLLNVGGTRPAAVPSTVNFTMTDAVSGGTLGSCQVKVIPDVGYSATTTVGCTVPGLAGFDLNAATVTASVTNPGR